MNIREEPANGAMSPQREKRYIGICMKSLHGGMLYRE